MQIKSIPPIIDTPAVSKATSDEHGKNGHPGSDGHRKTSEPSADAPATKAAAPDGIVDELPDQHTSTESVARLLESAQHHQANPGKNPYKSRISSTPTPNKKS